MKRHYRRAFTLVEIMFVTGIILLLLTLAFPALFRMWEDAILQNADQELIRILGVAKVRSDTYEFTLYGVFFYVNPQTNQQNAAYIKHKGVPENGEYWRGVADRFEIDKEAVPSSFVFANHIRISPLDFLEWDEEMQTNDDYKTGQHRGFFAIVFRHGKLFAFHPVVIHDLDSDLDGLGDMLNLSVNDSNEPINGPLLSIISDENDKPLRFEVKSGVIVYNESEFVENQNLSVRIALSINKNGDFKKCSLP